MGYHAKWDTVQSGMPLLSGIPMLSGIPCRMGYPCSVGYPCLVGYARHIGSSWAKLGRGVAHLAEVAAGVDLVRVEVADHLDVVRREELERAEHLAAAQTHKQTTSATPPTRLRRSRHAAAAARLGLVRAAWDGCCFVLVCCREGSRALLGSTTTRCSDCLRLSLPLLRLTVPLF